MKKPTDPRHLARIKIVEELFAQSFASQKKLSSKTKDIIKNLNIIDQAISLAAPQWHISKIAKIDLAILRLSVYELYIDKREPIKVIIDEAVEIAKSYGNDKSPSFINGVLATIVKKEKNE
ncbi:transcription antitermination factor NusB [Candidatus Gottesmanbacteria bacterium]|nr:transcription antitermination factor NusB [Candidatus Gottesmanbacteria bacterium]